jgi:DNA polymerase-3 subunit beta
VVIEEGSYIINAQKFVQTVRAMDGEELTVTVDRKNNVCIECNKSLHTMSAMPGEEFPALPTLMNENGFTVSQGVLRSTLGKVLFSMGVNDPRPVLNGCFFQVTADALQLVSCDSFKLSKCRITTALENRNSDGSALNSSFILPAKAVNELTRLLSPDEEQTVSIFTTRKIIVFCIGDVTFFSRLIEGEYINFDRIILNTHKIVSRVDKGRLLSALERAALVTEEKIAGSTHAHVKLEFCEQMVKISANSPAGSSYEELSAENEGGLVIAFNNRYLMDCLRSCETDEVVLHMSSALTSINITPVFTDEEAGTEDVFMLLPVRMKD